MPIKYSELGQDLWDVVRGFASEDLPPASQFSLLGETKSVKLQILHWLFESQHPSAIGNILGSTSVCLYCNCHRVLPPFDWYVLGYCITHSSCDWKLELDFCKQESLEIFLNAICLQRDQFLLPSKGQMKQMLFRGPNLATLHLLVTNVPEIFPNLTHLSLVGSELTSEECDLLCEHRDFLQSLVYLSLSCNPIGRGGAVSLISSFTKFSTLRELDLQNTGIGFEDCKALSPF